MSGGCHNNKYNKFFPSFSFFNKEFEPGNRLIDLFSDHFSFHFCSSNSKKHIEKLDEIVFRVSSNPSSTIVMSDVSIKNHVATSILYIHSYNKPVIKTLHRDINVTTTEAKLFAICCGINQVSRLQKVNLAVPYFLILIFFSFDLFSFSILELRVRVSDSITSHMIYRRR